MKAIAAAVLIVAVIAFAALAAHSAIDSWKHSVATHVAKAAA